MSQEEKIRYVCVDCDREASTLEFSRGHCNKCGGVVVPDTTGFETEFKVRRSRKRDTEGSADKGP